MKTKSNKLLRPLLKIAAVLCFTLLPFAAQPVFAAPPVANPDAYTVNEDTLLNPAASAGVLANDTGVQLTAVLIAGPLNALANSFVLRTDGSFQYQGKLNFNGTDSFTYAARSGAEQSPSVIVTITVRAVNDRPRATGFSVTTLANTPVAVLLRGTDVDGDTLTFRVTVNPLSGVVSPATGANRTYTPNSGFAGSDSFRYVVNDGRVDSAAATVNITVIPGISILDAPAVSEGCCFLPLNTARFTIQLAAASPNTVTVRWDTRDVTAHGGLVPGFDDYIVTSGIETFSPAGPLTKVVTVGIWGDHSEEPNETFQVRLSAAVQAQIVRGTATAIIVNDDVPLFGDGEGIPTDAITQAREPMDYGIKWTVPDPKVWRSLNTIDVRLIDEDGQILLVRWDETANTFSLFNPANGKFGAPALPGSKKRFETSAVTLLLENTEVIGSGPTGRSVLLSLKLSFKPQARDRTFQVQTLVTDDSGGDPQGYDTVGTISVLPR